MGMDRGTKGNGSDSNVGRVGNRGSVYSHDRALTPLRFGLLILVVSVTGCAVAFRFIHPDQPFSPTDLTGFCAILTFCAGAWGVELTLIRQARKEKERGQNGNGDGNGSGDG